MKRVPSRTKGSAINEGASRRLAHLIELVVDKDQAAFAELYKLTRSRLFLTALSILKRRDIAEEVLQEAYVKVWTNALSFNPAKGSPMTWMITIVRNLSITTARRRQLEKQCDDTQLINLPLQSRSVLEEIVSSQDEIKVLGLLKNLDPEKYLLIASAYIHGESRAALSDRLGVPVNTVKTWLRRTLMDLRVALEIHDNGCNSANS